MEELIIQPYIGIGKVKVGMTMEEVHESMGTDFTSMSRFNIKTDYYYSSNLRVDYDSNNVVNFIEVSNYITDYFEVFFRNVNVFKTKADELVSYLEQFSKYNHDMPETVIGCTYIFEDLGISVWRSRVFREENLKESWYRQMAKEEQEAELRFQYFETISLWSKGYYDQYLKGL